MEMTAEKNELRSLKLACAVYFVIFLLKLIVYLHTGVLALLAESLHTLTDVLVSVFLILAILYSRKRANARHMYGYGRTQNVAALVAATVFISVTSYKLLEEAIPHLFNAKTDYHDLHLVIGTIIISMLIATTPLISLWKQKAKGAAAKAQFIELINDELGLVAVLISTFLVMKGYPLADPIATIVVACIIAINALRLFRENASYLLGQSPGPEFLAKLSQLARSVPGVLDTHQPKAEFVGPNIVSASLHIVLANGTHIEKADKIAEEVEALICQKTACTYCIVHTDPIKEMT